MIMKKVKDWGESSKRNKRHRNEADRPAVYEK